MDSANSSLYVGSQKAVPLPGLCQTNPKQGSMETRRGEKIVSKQDGSPEAKHSSTSDKASGCMEQILAGALGAGGVIIGSRLAWNAFNSEPLLSGMVKSLSLSLGAGLVSGVLSENTKETAQNAAILGVLFAFCGKMTDV